MNHAQAKVFLDHVRDAVVAASAAQATPSAFELMSHPGHVSQVLEAPRIIEEADLRLVTESIDKAIADGPQKYLAFAQTLLSTVVGFLKP